MSIASNRGKRSLGSSFGRILGGKAGELGRSVRQTTTPREEREYTLYTVRLFLLYGISHLEPVAEGALHWLLEKKEG